MKKILSLLVLVLASVSVTNAQLRKIPSEVTNAFKAKYPDATNVSWKDKITVFQASFVNDGQEMKADFSSNNGWQETAVRKSFEQLPEDVLDGFEKSKYNEWTHGEYFFEILKNDNSIEYRIYVEKNAIQKKFLFFNNKGQLERESLTM
jgi:hypothetical protein